MELIKKAKWAYITVSIVLILFGICLVIWPKTSARTVCVGAGIIAVVLGIVKIVGYFSKDRFGLAFQFDLALGIFAMAAGILMMLHPDNIIRALPVILGIFLLIDGTFKIQTSVDAKRFGLERWWSILFFAILTCICGIVLIVSPMKSAVGLTVLAGITLIVEGIQNLWVVLYTVRISKNRVITVDYKEIER